MKKQYFILKSILLSIIFVFTLQFALVKPINAASNNPFGMGLAGVSDQDITDVAHLVNSNGGDWGYVTIVIQDNDLDKNKWQVIFDKLRRNHLIPIIRLATHAEGNNWVRPTSEDGNKWVDFLDSLNWVTKKRYIILFNEPNHASEWGGTVNAQSYSEIADVFAQKLKSKNNDYFIMLAGLDAAAPESQPSYEDEGNFLRDVIKNKPDIYNNIDGLASHSYPNPGFSGSPYSKGRNTVYNYEWELNLLKNLDVSKTLPVFITETGWTHADGQTYLSGLLSLDQVASNYETYLSAIRNDTRVIAVTPFVLDYQDNPFDHFSWKKLSSSDFYPQYQIIKDLTKPKGDPEQILKINTTAELPQTLLESSTYKVRLYLRNKGQAILDKDSFQIGSTNSDTIKSHVLPFDPIEPNNLGIVDVRLETSQATGSQQLNIDIFKNNEKKITLINWKFTVKPKPNLSFKTSLFPKMSNTSNDYEIQIFDKDQELVYKKSKLLVENNQGRVLGASNISLDGTYRVVILKPYYLPRQEILKFKEGQNDTSFQPMLPVDFNLDGKFSFEDIQTLIQKPWLLKLWLP